MATTQHDRQSKHEKNQESTLAKKETQSAFLKEAGLPGAALAQAAEMPAQAQPGDILALQERSGNDEVRRALKPEGSAMPVSEPLTSPSGELNRHISDEIQRARGGGAPLQPELSEQMAQRFGTRFDSVRIHNDPKADQLSRQLQARAFTIGSNIFFRQGAFAPSSPQGKQTLVHELSHVVQQSGSAASSGRLKLGQPGDPQEHEAERFAASQLAGRQQPAVRSGAAVQQGVVQRDVMSSIKGMFGKGNSTPAPPPPHPATATAEEWVTLQKLGVPDIPTWDGYKDQERGAIKTLANSDPAVARKLIAAKQAGHWPADEGNSPIYDVAKITLIDKYWISFEDWDTKIKKERRKEILEWAASNQEGLRSLVQAAKEDQWPQDENGSDLLDIAKIKLIQNPLSISFKDWKDKIPAGYRKNLLDLSAGTPPYLRALVTAALDGKWPKDDQDAEIKDDAALKKLHENITSNFIQWSGTRKENRKTLFDLAPKPFLGRLVNLSIANAWPKDGSDNEIQNKTEIEKIVEKIKLDFANWNKITEKAQRGHLLANADKDYIAELGNTAVAGKWPKDESNFILDAGKLAMIKEKMKLSFWAWGNIADAPQRGYLFAGVAILEEAHLAELAKSATSGVWPKDGADSNISDLNKWKLVKAVAPGFSPGYWNGFDATTRGAALAEPDAEKRKQIINEANYKRDSDETGLEKAGNVAEHTVVETLTGGLGLASNITSASKGTEDNAGVDRASGIVGAIGDAGSMLASGTSFLGSLARYRRGNKMASGQNYSRAAKAVGQKEKSKGAWGMATSGTGFFGSAFSFSGNMTKSIGAGDDASMATAGGLTGTAGVIGAFGSILGGIKSSMSVHGSRTRSNAAQGFVKKAPTGATLSPEELKMNQVAQFTAKNQNKSGRGLGLFKNIMSFGAGISTAVGGFGGIASKGVGLGGDIAGAVFGGLGLLGGLAQWGVESQTKPKDADVEAQVQTLIDLLQMGAPKGNDAAKFAKEVLKINFINLGDDKTWKDWIEEDPQAAKDLIKSKITKL